MFRAEKVFHLFSFFTCKIIGNEEKKWWYQVKPEVELWKSAPPEMIYGNYNFCVWSKVLWYEKSPQFIRLESNHWTVISILKLFLLLVDPSVYLVMSRWAPNRLLRILNLECYFEIVFLIVEEMQTAQPKMWLFQRRVRRYLNPMTGVFHFTTMRIRF